MAANDTSWPGWVREGVRVIAARDGIGRSRSTETVKTVTITKVTKRQVTTDDGQVWTQERGTGMPQQSATMGRIGRVVTGQLFPTDDVQAIDRMLQCRVRTCRARISTAAEQLTRLNSALEFPITRDEACLTERDVIAQQQALLDRIDRNATALRRVTSDLLEHRQQVLARRAPDQ